jgi:hypothetical protein
MHYVRLFIPPEEFRIRLLLGVRFDDGFKGHGAGKNV